MSEVWADLLDTAAAVRQPGWDSVPRHEPKAAILACSDARIPPSLVFGADPGDLFVVRVAGNTLTEAGAASLDYAVGHLGVDLIVVLGHTSCGAVAAAMAGACDGGVAAITASICSLAASHPDLEPDEIATLNVSSVVDAIRHHDGVSGASVRSGDVAVVGAIFDLATGRVRDVGSRVPSFSTPDHEEAS